LDFLQYKNFKDYCQKTGQDKQTAIKTVLENINNFSKQLQTNKRGADQ